MLPPGRVAGARLLGCAPADVQISADRPIPATYATRTFDAPFIGIPLLSFDFPRLSGGIFCAGAVRFPAALGGTFQIYGGLQFHQPLDDGFNVHFQYLGGHRRRFDNDGLGERLVPIGQN